MKEFFEHYLGINLLDEGTVTTQCPFHDDDTASMHVTIKNGKVLYHCKACDEGGSAVKFLSKVLMTSTEEAAIVVSDIERNSIYSLTELKKNYKANPELAKLITQFKISDKTLDKVETVAIVPVNPKGISFPIMVGRSLVDIRTYMANRTPKVLSMTGAHTGYLYPNYEMFSAAKSIILVEGEKDALTLIEHKLPGLTVTGGCMAIPDKTPVAFNGKEVIIMYDNDDAGRNGAKKTAQYILNNPHFTVKPTVKIADIGLLVKKDKGDVTDYFVELNGSKEELIEKVIRTAKQVSAADVETKQSEKVVARKTLLGDAADYTNEWLESDIQVSAVVDESYTIPASMDVDIENPDLTYTGPEHIKWTFDKWKHPEDVLGLVDNGSDLKFSKVLVTKNGGIGKPRIETYKRIPVYEVEISSPSKDTAETGANATIHKAYIIGKKVDSGKMYKIIYKLIPDKDNGNLSVAIIVDLKDLSKDIEAFKINNEVRNTIDKVKTLSFDDLIHNAQAHIGVEFNKKLITVAELTYNSAFKYNIGSQTNLKGCIDSIVVTNTGVGKSMTAERLRLAYGEGTRVSFTESASTVIGLIGGSKSVGGKQQTTTGVIPRNHRGLIIGEEIGKDKNNTLKSLTDIRTSGVAEITRLAGKITLPAMVRFLFFSNPKAQTNGSNLSVDSYTDGTKIIKDLVGTTEDIGRFDLIAVLGEADSKIDNNPFKPALVKKLTAREMQLKLKWVWSRTPEQIIWDTGAEETLLLKAEELNKVFESSMQIFGRKTWVKLSKVAVAIAAYECSTNDYETILVKASHLQKAADIFFELYDNPVFKLREVVELENRYSKVDEPSKFILKKYMQNADHIIEQLIQHNEMSRSELKEISDLAPEAYTVVIGELSKYGLIKTEKNLISASDKMRKTYKELKPTLLPAFPETVDDLELKNIDFS